MIKYSELNELAKQEIRTHLYDLIGVMSMAKAIWDEMKSDKLCCGCFKRECACVAKDEYLRSKTDKRYRLGEIITILRGYYEKHGDIPIDFVSVPGITTDFPRGEYYIQLISAYKGVSLRIALLEHPDDIGSKK